VTQDEIGKILTGNHERDAIHIAVAPVIAKETLVPGQAVGLIEDSVDIVGKHANPIGIVDPFLTTSVRRGEKFWMFLYPNTITSLKHNWTHPAFEDAEVKKMLDKVSGNSESRRFLEDYARQVQLSYKELLDAAGTYLLRGDDYCLSFDTPDIVYSQPEEFWKHYQIVTGEPVEDHSATFFRCAC
jgi:hypothetical protein